MKPQTIRKIDKYIGIPASFKLTIFRYIISLFCRKKSDQHIPGKIIFLKFIEQGATVLAYDAILRAIEMVGRENVYFWVFCKNSEIIRILNIIPENNIIGIRESNLFIFIYDILKSIRIIRKARIDTIVDLEFFSRSSAILTYLSGASCRVGYHRFTSEYSYRGNLLTHKNQYNPYIHTSLSYSLLVESIRLTKEEVPITKIEINNDQVRIAKYQPTEKQKEKIYKVLSYEFRGKIPSCLIILNPNASDLLPIRRWDNKNFISLAKMILNEYPFAGIIISGAYSEKEPIEEMQLKIASERVISMAGKTTLEELIVLYSFCDLIITNDSGPGHFSTLTDIKGIVLFGPETPKLYGPLGSNHTIICAKIACSPCVNVFNHRFSPCNHNMCMELITVDMVMKEIRKILI